MGKRKPGRPPKYDFRLKRGESADFPYSESLRICALQWGNRNNVVFSTTKNGETLTIKRTA